MKMRKFLRYLLAVVPYLIIVAIVFAVAFYPHKVEEAPNVRRVLTVWNVDTFEGGKGSRTSFLRKVARRVEKERDGVYFLVTSYTAEGAEAALAKGISPDILSFGVGLSAFAEESLPLPYSFAGGNIAGKCFAVPWCMGGYSLFSLTDNFEEAGRTAISIGGSNLPAVAANFAQIEGEEVESTAAYTGFLSGTYRYLLGTQRDVCRFQTRGVTVYERPLSSYNDLFQYVSVLKESNREDAFAFLEELLSPTTKEELETIGMYAVEQQKEMRTVSVFADANSLEKLASLARERTDAKNLDKFLKTV